MRLLLVCFLALAGWVAAAPGPLNSSNDTPEEFQQESEEDILVPAISDLARRKRGGSKASLPYSNYRPSGGIHRYRYPLYRKRSYRPQPSYDYEDVAILPEVESDYLEYEDQPRGPSLFRERSFQQQQRQDRRKKEMSFEDDGYFSDDYLPEKKMPPSPFKMPLNKKDTLYNLANTPYDLHTIGRMYEIGKRDDTSSSSFAFSPYDIESLTQIHSVGRKSPPRMSPSEQFYDAIDTIKRKKAMFDDRLMYPANDAEKMEHLLKLKNFLSSAAASRYLSSQSGQDASLRDPMIRKKRNAIAPNPKVVVTKTNTTDKHKDVSSTIPARYQQTQISGDRRKRAFNDYFTWERKALESESQNMEKRSSNNKDFDDYLTREYFKSIARSVGQKKKKRMAYAQFEADKRSGIDDFLENPSMLEYMQSKLKEAEEEVASEAEKNLEEGDTEQLLSNIVVRLDALERMREALGRLEELQIEEEEQQQQRIQRAVPSGLSAAAKKRQSSSSSSSSNLGTAGAASRKRSDDSRKKKKQTAVDARRMRRMRRGNDALPAIFLGNTREECPVLDRIFLNCVSVSEIVGDQDQAFLEPCIRHEVCYMCGSGLSVTGHECDAILSSSLEAACSGTLECLSAAGDTFNLLSNAERYAGEGTCTHDPCVRQFLESR